MASSGPVVPASSPVSASGSSASPTPTSAGRVLLIHGYSANWKGFLPWQKTLLDAGVSAVPIAVGNYVTLNNEVTIKDLGEGLDRALRLTPWSSGTKDDTFTFDAIVHSTGMLVMRQWLTSDPYLGTDDPRSRVRRLKHLVGLAPATFGSPQAKKGRSWLGALIKGNKDLGPDFLNAGDQVLSGLELASRYTWELAHKDMICNKPMYDTGPNTPYVAVFIGDRGYGGLAAVSNSPGADGTVRWAGCSLNTRKVQVDFRREPKLLDDDKKPTRYKMTPWVNERLAAPIIAVDGKNHGTILSDPDDTVRDLVIRFLKLSRDTSAAGGDSYSKWISDALDFGKPSIAKMNADSVKDEHGGAGWQQLVVHMIDDHGDPVTDYNVQLYIGNSLDDSDNADHPLDPTPVIVDAYSNDASYRCFYIRLSPEMLTLNTPGGSGKKMWLELIASSGSDLIQYEAYTGAPGDAPQSLNVSHEGGSPVKMDITRLAGGDGTLLYPYTTTLLEIFVEREPLPLGDVSKIFAFMQ